MIFIATSKPKKWGLFSSLIKWYQKTDYSHILLFHDDIVYQASHLSVNCYHIDVFLDSNNLVTVYEMEESEVDLLFVKKQLGKKYGVSQIFKIALLIITGIKLKGNGDTKFICSELVGKALKLDWVNDYTTPEEIEKYLRSVSGRK